ncbi:MAG: hypothetical protein P4L22_07780 [Candidatus Babeliales bacterium]|nr:hypothetical protein [Candidatus Babeliales bacterium]
MIELMNNIIITSLVGIISLGVAFGNSISAIAAIRATYIQPRANKEILKASLLGIVLSETSAIIGFVMAIILLGSQQSSIYSEYVIYSKLGIFFALCIPGFTIGLVSSLPVKYACMSIARQPFFSSKILNLMFLTLTFIQSPIIFGFIISLIINFKASSITTVADSIRMISAGLSLGIGSIGPSIGLALFAKSACHAIGINRNSYNKIFTFCFVSEALLETPIVFALITSLLLVSSTAISPLACVGMLASALCVGISNIFPGISSGRIAAAACQEIALNPNNYSLVSRTSLIAQGLIDSLAVYGWLISLMLIFLLK